MQMVARDLYQLPLTVRSGVNAYLVGDLLVDSGYPQTIVYNRSMLEVVR